MYEFAEERKRALRSRKGCESGGQYFVFLGAVNLRNCRKMLIEYLSWKH